MPSQHKTTAVKAANFLCELEHSPKPKEDQLDCKDIYQIKSSKQMATQRGTAAGVYKGLTSMQMHPATNMLQKPSTSSGTSRQAKGRLLLEQNLRSKHQNNNSNTGGKCATIYQIESSDHQQQQQHHQNQMQQQQQSQRKKSQGTTHGVYDSQTTPGASYPQQHQYIKSHKKTFVNQLPHDASQQLKGSQPKPMPNQSSTDVRQSYEHQQQSPPTKTASQLMQDYQSTIQPGVQKHMQLMAANMSSRNNIATFGGNQLSPRREPVGGNLGQPINLRQSYTADQTTYSRITKSHKSTTLINLSSNNQRFQEASSSADHNQQLQRRLNSSYNRDETPQVHYEEPNILVTDNSVQKHKRLPTFYKTAQIPIQSLSKDLPLNTDNICQHQNLVSSSSANSDQTPLPAYPPLQSSLAHQQQINFQMNGYTNFRTNTLLVSVLQQYNQSQNPTAPPSTSQSSRARINKKQPPHFQSSLAHMLIDNQNQLFLQQQSQKSQMMTGSLQGYAVIPPQQSIAAANALSSLQLHRRSGIPQSSQHYNNAYDLQSSDLGLHVLTGSKIQQPRDHQYSTTAANLQQPLQQQQDAQHFYFDYLFVQISQSVYDRDYAHRIKLLNTDSDTPQSQQSQATPSPLSPASSLKSPLPLYQLAKDTQYPNLKVIRDQDCTGTDTIHQLLHNTALMLQDMGKKFKVTVKKNYINDILAYQKSLHNFSHRVVLVVSESHPQIGIGIQGGYNQHYQHQGGNSVQKLRCVLSREQSNHVLSATEFEYDQGIALGKQRGRQQMQMQGQGYHQLYQELAEANENSVDSSTTSSSNFLAMNMKLRRFDTKQNITLIRQGHLSPRSFSKYQKSQVHLPKFTGLTRLQSQTSGRTSTNVNANEDVNSQISQDTPNALSDQVQLLSQPQQNAVTGEYPTAKIKICQKWEPSAALQNHPIPKLFKAYNEFIRLVFKNQPSYEATFTKRLPYLLKLAKKLGLQLQKGQLLPQNLLKSREASQLLKEKVFQSWCRGLASQNFLADGDVSDIFNKKVNEQVKLQVESDQQLLVQLLYPPNSTQLQQSSNTAQAKPAPLSSFKVHVGMGNNGQLVRQLFKQRYWWTLFDKEEMDKVNFMWTQCRRASCMQQLKPKLIVNQSQGAEVQSPSLRKVQQPQGQGRTEMYPLKVYNKLEDNYHLSNKKALFLNLKFYYESLRLDPFHALPVTFHVKSGLEDPEFLRFKQQFQACPNQKTNIWIIKPGENTNRGQGISVSKDWPEITSLIEQATRTKKKTCIIQKYIANPLLINKRKFDIRSFALMTSVNGNLMGYFYEEGYLRTSSREFSIFNLGSKLVHLTNDAIQMKAPDYGKFEAGNKLSYQEFQSYLDQRHADKCVSFDRDLLPQLKKLTADCMKAVWGKIDPNKRLNTFEVFGLDFMFDEEFKPYLIEVNTNPCLELSSPLLARLIPSMLENALKIMVDPLFPPPEGFSQKKQVVQELCPECRFQLVFAEKIDGKELEQVFAMTKNVNNVIVELEEDEISDEALED